MEEVVQLGQEQAVGMTVTLFVKKLWNMVNDKSVEHIISWNSTGDSFIIHDQLQLATTLLPRYFKHNTMASFVRQLNFYNFRKVANTKNQAQFAHSCFLKDVPKVLVFIKRKHSYRSKENSSTDVDEQVKNLLTDVTEIKRTHSQIDKEMSLLKQDKFAIWNELNSLRMKYEKQSSVINQLLQFLITYIHKHQTPFSNQNIRVSRNINLNELKSGPTLIELDYINPKDSPKKSKTESCSVLQPGTSKSITYSLNIPDSGLQNNGKMIVSRDSILQKKSPQSLKQILSMKNAQGEGITYSVELPGNQTRKIAQSDIQNSLLQILKENENMCVDNYLEEILTEIQAGDNEFIDTGDNQPIVQSPPMEDSSSVPTNSKKMHSLVIPETNCAVEYPNQSGVNFTNETGDGNYQNLISTPLGKKSYMNISKTSNNSTKNFIQETSYSNHPKRIPEKKKTFQTYGDSQCPSKKSKEMVQLEVQKSLLEISDENGTLSTENPLKNLLSDVSEQNRISDPVITKQINPVVDQVQETYPIIENPRDEMNSNNCSLAIPQSSITDISEIDITEFSDKDLEPIIQSPTDEIGSLNMLHNLTQFSILENPKQNFSLYLENTQEELNMLQEIINSLNPKDFESSIDVISSLEAICSTEENNENEIANINESLSE